MTRFRGLGYPCLFLDSPGAVDERLRRIADAGYTHAEFGAEAWDVWVGGRVVARQLARFAAVADRHRGRLRFTLHAPYALDLADDARRESQLGLLGAALDVARRLAADVLVLHPGHPASAEPPNRTVARQQREQADLRRAGDAVAAWGGEVAVENPTPPSLLAAPGALIAQVRAVGHPAVGVCLDVGHLFLAARVGGFDFIAAARELAPYTVHLHLHDNFGLPGGDTADPALGTGDLHLPPGFGAVPFDRLFAEVDFPRRPVLYAEVEARRDDGLEDILADLRRWTLGPSG